MHHSQQPEPKRTEPRAPARGGFALIAALTVMAFVFLLLVSLVTLSSTEMAGTATNRSQLEAREIARTGLMVALGQLQQAAGPDQRVTARAEILGDGQFDAHARYWTGVWDTTAPTANPTWLVSGSNPDARYGPGNDTVTLVSERQTTDDTGAVVTLPEVRAAKVSLQDPNGNPRGAYAYWISDEGVKADVSVTDRTEFVYAPSDPSIEGAVDSNAINFPAYYDDFLRLAAPARAYPESLLPLIDLEPSDDLHEYDASRSLNYEHLYAWQNLSAQHVQDDLVEAYHEVTIGSSGLLVDTVDGGLRINLTDPTYQTAPIDAEIRNFLTPRMGGRNDRNYSFHDDSATEPRLNRLAPPTAGSVSDGDAARSLVPLLSEFKLYIGLFHTDSDEDLRIRFHLEGEFWNPYPHDLIHENSNLSYDRGYILVVDDLPEIEMQIDHVPASLVTVDLSDFPLIGNNSTNEKLINSWVEIDSVTNSGRSFFGFEGGEVYRSLNPQSQSSGLARNLTSASAGSADNWVYDDGVGNDKPVGSEPVFKPNTRITVATTPATRSRRVDVHILPYMDNPIGYNQHPLDDGYAEPLLTFQDIPFDALDFDIKGNELNRSTSGSYTIANYNIAYHFRLRDDLAPEDLARLLGSIDPRNPVIDFGDPEVLELFEVTADPVGSLATASHFSGLDILHDETVDSHGGSNRTVYFSDIPTHEPLSPAALRHFPFYNVAPLAIGSPNTGSARVSNNVFDDFFCTGVPGSSADPMNANLSAWSALNSNGEPNPLPNARLELCQQTDGTWPGALEMRSSDAAQFLSLRGAFNINSTSVDAWTIALTRNLKDFAYGTNQTKDLNQVFIRAEFSAHRAEEILTDAELLAIANFDVQREQTYKQQIRVLDNPGRIRALAQAIVTRIQDRGYPFESLEAFANSGVVEQAITDVRLNYLDLADDFSAIDGLAPIYVRQSDIIAQLSTFMSARSDTFKIRAYGENFHELTGEPVSKVALEATVRRSVYPYDWNSIPPADRDAQLQYPASPYGRRLEVISMRWLGEGEF